MYIGLGLLFSKQHQSIRCVSLAGLFWSNVGLFYEAFRVEYRAPFWSNIGLFYAALSTEYT